MMVFGLCMALLMVYAAIVVMACVGWLIRPPAVSSQPAASVRQSNISVVVPFRNEENNLPVLLRSLHAQNYPLEIILVNDHSTDGSVKNIRGFMDEHTGTLLNIRVLLNTGEGKKKASITGVKAAADGQIVFTDADCMFPQGFFDQLQAEWVRDADFVYGPVIYAGAQNFMGDVFFLDQLALNAVAIGLGGVGIHTYCSGANMGGKKDQLVLAADDLAKAGNLSGDDVTYLQHAVRKKQKIKVLTGPALTISTRAPGGWGAFLGQRLRWGQKAPVYRGFALPALSACVWLVCCMVLAVLIGCFSGKLTGLWWGIPLGKLCIDLLFLFLVALRLRLSRYLWAFLPAWLLNLLYIPVVAVLGLVVNPTWKGRKVKTTTPR